MPLSRHFYPLDDVHAALMFSASRGRTEEAVFWTMELLSSGCGSEAISTLFQTWLLHRGPFAISWFLTALERLGSEELTEEDILQSVRNLCHNPIGRDHSVWNILVGFHLCPDQPDRVVRKTPPWALCGEYDKKWMYLFRALYQGKGRCAWWITRSMGEEEREHALQLYAEKEKIPLVPWDRYETLLGFASDGAREAMECVWVLFLSLSVLQREKSMMREEKEWNPRLLALREEWSGVEGRKARRVYSIPVEALYGLTRRGRMTWTTTTMGDLTSIEKQLIGCPFWEDAIESYDSLVEGQIQWSSPNQREAFYRQYFPDDIPDEWDLAEKKKSHGDGVLSPKEGFLVARWSRIHWGTIARLAWGSIQTTVELLRDKKGTGDWMEFLSESSLPMIRVKEEMLEPVIRRISLTRST